MFSFFRKKSQVEKLIDKDGMDHATDRFAEVVSRKIPNREIAYQFILEELEAASMGNSTAKRFAADSGIVHSEFKGALQNSRIEVDGPDGPQMLLIGLTMELKDKPDMMVEFRCKVDERIMKTFGFGKFSKNSADSNPAESGVSELWIDKLRSWAEEIGLEDLKWEVQPRNRDGGFWTGFPRDAKRIRELEGLRKVCITRATARVDPANPSDEHANRFTSTSRPVLSSIRFISRDSGVFARAAGALIPAPLQSVVSSPSTDCSRQTA